MRVKSGPFHRTSTRPRRETIATLRCVMYCLLFFMPLVASASTWSAEDAVLAHVKQNYPWAEIEVTELRLSAEQPAKPPVAITAEKTPPGRSVFRFHFRDESSITATALVRAYDRVFLSRSGFRKGYVLQQNDVYATRMETGRIPQGAVRDENRIVGKPLLRSVIPNMPITDALVSDKPFMKRGHKVVLVAESAGFSIKSVGELKQDAMAGEQVRVLSQMSKKIVTGILLDENTVRVEF